MVILQCYTYFGHTEYFKFKLQAMQQNQVNHLKFTFIQLAKNMSIEEKKEGCNTWVTSKKQPRVV